MITMNKRKVLSLSRSSITLITNPTEEALRRLKLIGKRQRRPQRLIRRATTRKKIKRNINTRLRVTQDIQLQEHMPMWLL